MTTLDLVITIGTALLMVAGVIALAAYAQTSDEHTPRHARSTR